MDACRIVLLIENMSFPRDPRVRREAIALADAGCTVSVVCPKGRTKEVKSFEVINGVNVHRYWQPWQGNSVLSYICEYGWAMLVSFALIFWIWLTDGFDVLHAANPPDLFFVVAAPFMLFGKKFVYDQHDLCPELLEFKFGGISFLRTISRFMERCSYKLADLVIVSNQSAYDLARQRGGVNENKLCIVRNAPDLDCLDGTGSGQNKKSPEDYLAVYVGVIAKQDGVDRVVRAAHHILHEKGRKDVRFVVLGDGELLGELKQLARSLDVESQITFTGWLEDSEVFSYLRVADVCLAPDPPAPINQLSTFIKIMEYMRFGKVTVSFDLLESRRTAGDSAIYVDRDDYALFGDAILEILDNRVRREKMGRVASDRIRSSLHWGLSRNVLLAAYQRVIQRGVSFSGRKHASDTDCEKVSQADEERPIAR